MPGEEIIILQIFIIFGFAKIVGEIFERFKQPSVIGELIVGIIFGTSMIYGTHGLDLIQSADAMKLLSELGVIFLLFTVGLETRLSDLKKVGTKATMVAILGVVLPFSFGYIAIVGMGYNSNIALFVAAAMVATSVGITARVLYDLRFMRSKEAKIILGAAVIDDVLGMIVLTLVAGAAKGDSLSYFDIIFVAGLAIGFVIAVMILGEKVVGRAAGRKVVYHEEGRGKSIVHDPRHDHLRKMHMKEGPFVFALILCFGLSAVASLFGLTAIIGAFLAGMAFADVQEGYKIQERMLSINELLVPFFFVYVGMQVDLSHIGNVLGLAIFITVLAIVTKLIGCGLAAYKMGKSSAMIIGTGMIPRGEVGIIIAGIGIDTGILTGEMYLVVIIMAIATTLVAPPALSYLIGKQKKEKREDMKKSGQNGKKGERERSSGA